MVLFQRPAPPPPPPAPDAHDAPSAAEPWSLPPFTFTVIAGATRAALLVALQIAIPGISFASLLPLAAVLLHFA